MAKTYIDQIVDYPAKVMLRIAEDNVCSGLILNKNFNNITDEDKDKVLEENIKDYQYIDDTSQETAAYVWVEMDINRIENRTVKNCMLYITVCCHKNYMKISPTVYKGILGNRRDNLVRYIDKLLSNTILLGIGKLTLKSVRTVSPINGFTARELSYEIPDFNIMEIDE